MKTIVNVQYQVNGITMNSKCSGDSSDDEIMLNIFIEVYESLGLCVEWLGDSHSPIHISELQDDSLEFFNRMKFNITRTEAIDKNGSEWNEREQKR
jgi:hypothetical protein